MLTFAKLEIPTPDGPAVISVRGTLQRSSGLGPDLATGGVELRGQHLRHDFAGQILHAHVPTAELIRDFPEFAPSAGDRPWALIPLFLLIDKGRSAERPCRMAGPPTFGDPALPAGE